MTQQFRIFVVDDERGMCELLSSILADDYAVESFPSAEACRDRLPRQLPDMFLLDVGLPGEDGYEFCRRIKNSEQTRHIPVTFVSGHDTIEARLQGYEAGGEDFIVKPFEPEELLSRVKVAQRIQAEQNDLRAQATFAQRTAFSAMTSMGDLGIIIEFLRKSFACTTARDLAQAMLDVVGQYSLQGATQVRLGRETLSLSPQGTEIPLEKTILDHVSTLGRIFEFQKRGVYNYGGITVLVSNLPVEDAERVGRIRDNLAILTEAADARRQAIELEQFNRRAQQGIGQALSTLQATLDQIRAGHQRNQLSVTELIINVQEDMVKSFVKLGLSESSENFMIDLVKRHLGLVLDRIDGGRTVIGRLEEMEQTLRTLAA